MFTTSLFGILTLFLIHQSLVKSTIYRSPISLARKSKNMNPDYNFFLNPFVLFIFTVFLNIRFLLFNNYNRIMNRKLLQNFGFILYLILIFFVSLSFLFYYNIQNNFLRKTIANLFRIPDL